MASMDVSTNNKVTCKRLRPNAELMEWLIIMYEEAKCKNSPLKNMLNEALESVNKYPLPITSGAECRVLKGFNMRLCVYIDKLLQQLNAVNKLKSNNNEETDSDNDLSEPCSVPLIKDAAKSGRNTSYVDLTKPRKLSPKPDSIQHIPVDEVQDSNAIPSASTKNTIEGKVKAKKGLENTRKYKPAPRSGGYAILVTLLEQSFENPDQAFLTKEDLIEKAQKHSEESFVRPKPNTYYTAWSSITTLERKGLVTKDKKKKAEYKLTEKGKELAREILEDAKNIPTANDIIFENVPSTSSAYVKQNVVSDPVDDEIPSTSADNNVIEMAPDTFDIILLIDKNETGGLRKKNDPTVAQFKKFSDLKHDYRSLKVGDFTWIAKHKVNQDQELVLPFIVERKRMDDLASSIKDGRFHEQKFRLRKCGIENVIYLIENYGKNKHVGLPIQSLMQALANTRVQDGFKVHVTDSLTNTVRFLAIMTKRLTIRYKNAHLRGCNNDPHGAMLMTFDYFNKSSAKNKPLTVTDTFIKLLLQLKGMSVDKALAITKKYPTPRSLINAYVKCARSEGELLLAHLKYGDLNRNVGPATSKSIYQLFSSSGDE